MIEIWRSFSDLSKKLGIAQTNYTISGKGFSVSNYSTSIGMRLSSIGYLL
jgi:hypothetical protein